MLLDHLAAGQAAAADQVVHGPLGGVGDGDRGHAHALLAGELQERPPAAADVEHPLARLNAAGIEGVAELAFHSSLDRLIVILEEAVRIAAQLAVEPEEEELGIDVVVALDPLLVAPDLAEE